MMSELFFGKDNRLDRFCERCGLGLTKSDLNCRRCDKKKPRRERIKKYSGASKSENKYNNYQ